MQIEETELAELRNIDNAVRGRTAALARSILCFGYQECESNFPQEPLARKKSSTQRVYDFENEISLSASTIAQHDKLKVYPNPAKDFIAIELSNFNADANYRLQLITLEGKVVFEQKLIARKTKINTAQLTKGSYLVSLFEDSEQTEETVLIIQ